MRPRDCTRVVPVNVAIAPAWGDRDLVHDCVERERLRTEPEGSARDRRDQRHLVAVLEVAIPVGVFLVHGVKKALGLVAEIECRPDIGDTIDPVELALTPTGAFAQARKQAYAHGHEAQIIARAATLSE